MVLDRSEIAGIVQEALAEIGMTFADGDQLEATSIARVRQQLHDAGGTTWDPSPNVLAGLIVVLFLEKKNYPRDFKGEWFDKHLGKKVEDLIDYLNGKQVSVG
jgi:hypothetical protein